MSSSGPRSRRALPAPSAETLKAIRDPQGELRRARIPQARAALARSQATREPSRTCRRRSAGRITTEQAAIRPISRSARSSRSCSQRRGGETASDEIKGGTDFRAGHDGAQAEPEDAFSATDQGPDVRPEGRGRRLRASAEAVSEPVQGRFAPCWCASPASAGAGKSFEDVAQRDPRRPGRGDAPAGRARDPRQDRRGAARRRDARGGRQGERSSTSARSRRSTRRATAGRQAGRGSADVGRAADGGVRGRRRRRHEALNEGDAYVWFDVRGVDAAARPPVRRRRAPRSRSAGASRRSKSASPPAPTRARRAQGRQGARTGRRGQKLERRAVPRPRARAARRRSRRRRPRRIFQTPAEGFGQTPTDEKGARLVYRVTAANDRPYDPARRTTAGRSSRSRRAWATTSSPRSSGSSRAARRDLRREGIAQVRAAPGDGARRASLRGRHADHASIRGLRAGLRRRRGAGRLRRRSSATWRRRSRPISSSPRGAPNAFLFESVEGGATRGRYSIIGLKPDLIWRCAGRRAPRSTARPLSEPDAFAPCPGRPLDALRALLAESAHRRCRTACRRWRPACSAISATTWCARWRTSARPTRTCCGVPDAIMMRPTVIVVFDSVKDEITVVTPVRPEAGVPAESRTCARRRPADRDRRGARPRRAEGAGRRARARATATP